MNHIKERKDWLWFNLQGIFLFLIALTLLGFNEEMVLYACTFFFLSVAFFFLKDQVFYFFLEKKIEIEKEYLYLFYLKLSKLKMFYELTSYLKFIFTFFLSFMFFSMERLKGIQDLSGWNVF